MRQSLIVAFFVLGLFSSQPFALGQDTELEKLQQENEILALKLKLAEQQVQLLENELEKLRSEYAELKEMKLAAGEKEPKEDGKEEPMAEVVDQFRVGAVWVGISKDTSNKKTTKWAISVAERDGKKFSGGLAIQRDGKEFEVPFSGTAPAVGDGLIVLETPVMGRAKLYCRGRITNGAASLAFSGTTPLGQKIFGSAAMRPE